MADTQTKVEIATLGTRETVLNIAAEVVGTDVADNTFTTAVVFAKPFVNPPLVLGVTVEVVDAAQAIASCTEVTTTGCNVNLHQVIELPAATYIVNAKIVGWKAS